MAQVMQPKPPEKKNPLGIAGAIVGGIYGGPQGAMTGMNLGNSVGGMMTSNSAQQQPGQVESTAMSRRLGSGSAPAAQEIAPQDNYQALHEADLALAQQPADVQQQYGATIKAAKLAARRNQNGMA